MTAAGTTIQATTTAICDGPAAGAHLRAGGGDTICAAVVIIGRGTSRGTTTIIVDALRDIGRLATRIAGGRRSKKPRRRASVVVLRAAGRAIPITELAGFKDTVSADRPVGAAVTIIAGRAARRAAAVAIDTCTDRLEDASRITGLRATHQLADRAWIAIIAVGGTISVTKLSGFQHAIAAGRFRNAVAVVLLGALCRATPVTACAKEDRLVDAFHVAERRIAYQTPDQARVIGGTVRRAVPVTGFRAFDDPVAADIGAVIIGGSVTPSRAAAVAIGACDGFHLAHQVAGGLRAS